MSAVIVMSNNDQFVIEKSAEAFIESIVNEFDEIVGELIKVREDVFINTKQIVLIRNV